MTDTEQMLEWDAIVSDALGKRPGESIVDASRRVMASPHGHLAWRVAAVFTSRRRTARFDAWTEMRNAARIACRLAARRTSATEEKKQ